MRIAYFTDTFEPEINGVVNTLTRLNEYLHKKGIEFVVFAPAYNEDTVNSNANIHRYRGFSPQISPKSCLAFPRSKDIFTLCDQFQPDIIHVTTEFGIGYKGLQYARSRNLPLVKSYHTNFEQYLKYHKLGPLYALAKLYLKWFCSPSEMLLVPSKNTLNQLKEQNYQNLDIWSRGIDTQVFNPSFRSQQLRRDLGIGDRFAYLYCGRLSAEKGLDTLMAAIEQVNQNHQDNVVFILTGDGPYAAAIKAKNYPNVVMTGFAKGRRLSELYASCDGFAFPSGTETFGNSALEAIASGLPLVGVNSGGITDFLTHGDNALLGTPDCPNTFSKHLIQLMEDKPLYEKMRTRAIATAATRSWDDIFDGLIQKYEKIINKKKKPVTGNAMQQAIP